MTQLAGALSSFAVVAVIAIALPAHAARPVEGGSSPPDVNMERLLMAAQLDGYRPGNRTTAGAVKSVKRVQRALRVAVDGNFGSQTMLAYSQWQQRLSIDANGLPDETSLTRLGEGRFEVKRIVRPGSQVDVGEVGDEQEINRRTNRMKIAAARKLRRDCKFSVTQGSYSTDVGESAGTHAGGGALDISVKRGCGERHRSAVRALRQVGFAAWHRPYIRDVWEEHIHAIAISDPKLSGPAQEQVSDYYRGRNGLADDGLDEGPDVTKRTWEQYKRSR